jgi:hypothetical protein
MGGWVGGRESRVKNCLQQSKSTVSRGITKYLEPEVAKQFDTSKGKTLSSGKVAFSESVTAKKWTAAAKRAIANLNKKTDSKMF